MVVSLKSLKSRGVAMAGVGGQNPPPPKGNAHGMSNGNNKPFLMAKNVIKYISYSPAYRGSKMWFSLHLLQ